MLKMITEAFLQSGEGEMV